MTVTDNKLPDDVTFKNVAILVTCISKDDGKFYPQLFLEEALIAWKIISIATFYQFF